MRPEHRIEMKRKIKNINKISQKEISLKTNFIRCLHQQPHHAGRTKESSSYSQIGSFLQWSVLVLIILKAYLIKKKGTGWKEKREKIKGTLSIRMIIFLKANISIIIDLVICELRARKKILFFQPSNLIHFPFPVSRIDISKHIP